MLELLMSAGKAAEGIPEADVIFLWDPTEARDLIGSAATITLIGATSIDPDYQIDGVNTMLFPGTTSGATITFETPLVLNGLDWTIEWSAINAAAASSYANEFAMYSGVTGNGMLARWGDAGFGNRLQFGNKFAAAADCFNIALSKAGSVGQLSRFALVCKNSVVSVFRNGIKQSLAVGTGSTYNQASFPAGTALTDLRAIRLGWLSSSVPTNASRHGRIRISKNALYTTNYTPQPF